MTRPLEERLIQARMYLMNNSPFFATLLLNAPVIITDRIPTAATNGKNLLLNPEFMGSLTDAQLTGVLCHEVLHMAFNHVGRLPDLPDPPDPETKQYFFNYAADIVVNGVVLTASNLQLPDGHIRDTDLEDKSLEEIYAELLKDPPFDIQKVNVCMGSGSGEGDEESESGAAESETGSDMKDHWEEVLERAKQAEQMGKGTSELLRKINAVAAESTMDYRRALAEWIVPSTGDWGEYDRRFIYDDIYIDTNISDSLTLRVFIDTSGSVCTDTLSKFIYEVKDNIALSNWAKVNVEGYFFDTQLYGPYDSLDDLLDPKGFGGTDFDPIINLINKESLSGTEVNIIFTDGYADIPDCELNNVVWILGSANGITRSVYDFIRRGWNHVYKFKDN